MNALVWISGAGAIGAAVNASINGNAHLTPVAVSGNGARIVRFGLGVSVLVGVVASAALLAPIVLAADGASFGAAAYLPAALGIGALAGGWIANDTDKRLLHAAVLCAASSPGAHPKTVEAMRTASPYKVFTIARETLPMSTPSR